MGNNSKLKKAQMAPETIQLLQNERHQYPNTNIEEYTKSNKPISQMIIQAPNFKDITPPIGPIHWKQGKYNKPKI